MARLIEVVTGGSFELGLIESFGGIKQTDAAVYIAKGVLAVATGAFPATSMGRRRQHMGPAACSVCSWWLAGGGQRGMPAAPPRLRCKGCRAVRRLPWRQGCRLHAACALQAATCRSSQSGSARAPQSSFPLMARVRGAGVHHKLGAGRRMAGCTQCSGARTQRRGACLPCNCAPPPQCFPLQRLIFRPCPASLCAPHPAFHPTCLPPAPRAAVVERRTTAAGAEYIRVVLGTSGGAASEVEDPSTVIDAEFLFLAGGHTALL